MREKLNSNPLVQAGLIGVLALIVGLMLLMRMGGSADPAAEVPATDPAATAAATDPAAAAADPAAVPAVDPATGAAIPATPATPVPTGVPTSDFKPGPGLPKEVVDAYDAGKAVVLLVVNERGIDDRDLQKAVEKLRARPDVALFVTKVSGVSRYSRITEGVDVNRTPALIVVRPKSLTEGPMPTAVVSYGFRGERSVEQAVDDALYKGPADLPYYP